MAEGLHQFRRLLVENPPLMAHLPDLVTVGLSRVQQHLDLLQKP